MIPSTIKVQNCFQITVNTCDTLLDLGELQSDWVKVLVTIKLGSKVGKFGEICNEVDLVLCNTSICLDDRCRLHTQISALSANSYKHCFVMRF